jgi:hypothetical protein
MKIGQAFPSKYVKTSDLGGKRVTVKIDRVEIEDVGGDEDKPVLYFQGRGKAMVLNVTNANMISSVYGEETGDWHGREIELRPEKTTFQGKVVDCIRVHVPQIEPAAAAADDDEIPF